MCTHMAWAGFVQPNRNVDQKRLIYEWMDPMQWNHSGLPENMEPL